MPAFLWHTGNHLPRAVSDGCLAHEIASGIAGSGGNREFKGPTRWMRGALVGSYRSFPPVWPFSCLNADAKFVRERLASCRTSLVLCAFVGLDQSDYQGHDNEKPEIRQIR